jgi:hypothetical protein
MGQILYLEDILGVSGDYSNPNLTVDGKGRIIAISGGNEIGGFVPYSGADQDIDFDYKFNNIIITRPSSSGVLTILDGSELVASGSSFVANINSGDQVSSGVPYDGTNSGLGANIQEAVDTLNSIVSAGGNATNQGTWLVSGGGVAWVDSYIFNVASAQYYILGIAYTSASDQVTLSAADGTHNRFDAIYVDDQGVVGILEGTPAATPSLPSHDAGSQIILSYVRVDAGTTSPTTIPTDLIYAENSGTPVEWSGVSSNASIVLDSVSNPYEGTYSIQGTSAGNGHYFEFQDSAPQTLEVYSDLIFYIRIPATWPSQKSVRLSFYNGSSQVGTTVALSNGFFGFSSSLINVYQTIVIPLNMFNVAAGTPVNKVRFAVAGGGPSIGFNVDNIKVQGNQVDQPSSIFGITTLNLLTGSVQTLDVGTAGTNFNIVSSGTTHTFNIPDASTTNRGAVNTSTQTIAGNKTFEVTVFANETIHTPSGTTVAINLNSGNHQTLNLMSASGDVTVTLTPPTSVGVGTILTIQHSGTVRDLTWTPSSGSIAWMGGEPDWAADAVDNVRIVSWRSSGSTIYMAATDVAS